MIIENFKKILLFFMVLFFGGCVTVPVQEMSDARQTIASAYEVKADKYASEALTEAEVLLNKASLNIDEGEYEEAKRHAIDARERAAAARDIAIYKRKAEKTSD
ncbi:MAG: DUF4398 domain-containing protein [Gammaproteobacteria bacterium]|nr:MAG: DUF4398 domain-containing protein [Gammaproteobacteria bacterium]